MRAVQECLVLAARRYDFKGEDGGRVDGLTLTYVTDEAVDGDDQRGLAVMTTRLPIELFHQLQEVPGYYSIEFQTRPGPKGRPALQAVALAYDEAAVLARASASRSGA